MLENTATLLIARAYRFDVARNAVEGVYTGACHVEMLMGTDENGVYFAESQTDCGGVA